MSCRVPKLKGIWKWTCSWVIWGETREPSFRPVTKLKYAVKNVHKRKVFLASSIATFDTVGKNQCTFHNDSFDFQIYIFSLSDMWVFSGCVFAQSGLRDLLLCNPQNLEPRVGKNFRQKRCFRRGRKGDSIERGIKSVHRDVRNSDKQW